MANLELKKKILCIQKNEITEYVIYKNLAAKATADNKKVLEQIAANELTHYNFWKRFTDKDVRPSKLKILFHSLISRFLGLNFSVRLMERGEELAQKIYEKLKTIDPRVADVLKDEEKHENDIINLLDKKELAYTGSIVLGLNDALVELTGVLAGLTLALQKTKIVAVVGLITGIAASLSMAASSYLSSKEEALRNPSKSSFYTGLAYIFAVLILITPYFIFENPFLCLAVSIFLAIFIIFIFTFYISVTKNLSFKKRFAEMALISVGIAIVNFFIGFIIKKYLDI